MLPHTQLLNTLLSVLLYLPALLCLTPVVAQQPVFLAGKEGYATYRIPAIIRAPNGDLLAFCEGRVHNAGDFGNIDIVMKRSSDGGKTWSSLNIIIDADSLQAGNPAPVVDKLDPNFPKGRIFLFYNTGNNHESEVRKGKGQRDNWYVTSTDQGQSWSSPTNISAQTHRRDPPFDWRSYANTPGHALQLEHGRYRGRLYVAANHSEGSPQPQFQDYRSHGFFSDDHGKSFLLSASVDLRGSNESTAAEVSGNGLLLNSRNQRGDRRARIISNSSDGGQRWDKTTFDTVLIDPVCQGSLLNIGWKKGRALLAFCNPASTTKRDSLLLRISADEGRHWKWSLLVDHDRQSLGGDYTAYSDLLLIHHRVLGVLYERSDYREIVFTPITIPRALRGKQR